MIIFKFWVDVVCTVMTILCRCINSEINSNHKAHITPKHMSILALSDFKNFAPVPLKDSEIS